MPHGYCSVIQLAHGITVDSYGTDETMTTATLIKPCGFFLRLQQLTTLAIYSKSTLDYSVCSAYYVCYTHWLTTAITLTKYPHQQPFKIHSQAKMKSTTFVCSSPFSESICWLLFRDCSISKNLPTVHRAMINTLPPSSLVTAYVCESGWSRPASERLSSPSRTSGGEQGTSELPPKDSPPKKILSNTGQTANLMLSTLLVYLTHLEQFLWVEFLLLFLFLFLFILLLLLLGLLLLFLRLVFFAH